MAVSSPCRMKSYSTEMAVSESKKKSKSTSGRSVIIQANGRNKRIQIVYTQRASPASTDVLEECPWL